MGSASKVRRLSMSCAAGAAAWGATLMMAWGVAAALLAAAVSRLLFRQSIFDVLAETILADLKKDGISRSDA